MASMTERLLKAWHKYDSRQNHRPTSLRQAADWALAEGFIDTSEFDITDIIADRMGNAIRSETRTDPQGRRYRVNHAVRVTRQGVQYTFWGVMGFAPHEHMQKSFAQRRNQIIDDNFHLKTDIDVYNETLEDQRQRIQLVLDYTEDIAEREELERIKNRRKDVA
jgi:hypothetical protein